MIYATQRADAAYASETLGVDAHDLTETQWAQIHEHAFERRYGHPNGANSLLNNSAVRKCRRRHPICWIRQLSDEDTLREFAETLRYCSIDQLGFPGYKAALVRGAEQTGLDTGLVTGRAKIAGFDVVLAVNNFGLVVSSLCDEIGEKRSTRSLAEKQWVASANRCTATLTRKSSRCCAQLSYAPRCVSRLLGHADPSGVR